MLTIIQIIKCFQCSVDINLINCSIYIQGCLPYKIPPCDHKIINRTRPRCDMNYIYPKCVDKCDKGYKIPFSKDLHFGK